MTRELSLAEETTLLLYGSVLSADGTRSDDVFSKYGESGSLVARALLMDLATRGRLRMERPKPAEKRAKSDGWLWSLGWILLFLTAMFGPLAVTVWWNLLPVIPYTFASFPLCLLIILVANLRVALRTGFMVIVDTSPVGEEMLDVVLKGLMRVGLRKRLATYIRRYFDIVRLSTDLAYLRARLEWRRCVLPAASGKQSTFFGMVDVRRVDRAHPAFRAIGERVRRLLLGEVTDPDVVALALLFARREQGVVLGRRGARPLHGLYQFFASDEIPGAKRRLRAIAAGRDTSITAQMGGDLYDTFLAIVHDLEDLRADSSISRGGWG